MDEIQAIQKNSSRRLVEQIRQDMAVVRLFYRSHPYCDDCKCRAPAGHKDHIFKPMFSDD